jgi:serine/threonine-protein kinase
VAAGLTAAQITSEPTNSAKPAGTVVRTEPAAGQTVAGDATVKLFVSNGSWKLVPDVVNKTEAQARTILEFQGFTAEPRVRTAVAADPAQVGKVISQDPLPGTERDPANPVTIVIGIAPATSAPPTTPDPTGTP